MSESRLSEHWRDITAQLLKIGATAYGGPAIMGVMQAELQEKRQWVSKERFALLTFVATVVVLMLWRVATIKVMLGGAVLGIARSRLLKGAVS
jgi:hypothetical protein